MPKWSGRQLGDGRVDRHTHRGFAVCPHNRELIAQGRQTEPPIRRSHASSNVALPLSFLWRGAVRRLSTLWSLFLSSLPFVIDMVRPSIVQIRIAQHQDPGQVVGTGFFVHSDGFVLTAKHVRRERLEHWLLTPMQGSSLA